ncbi:DUF5615 family PIN-like protein [Georgenia sp. TF02-10]|nr:DUF5615 family PIN-like protein [Georgenia sp. TF02-10]UNX55560.1 DUF5615 family PIN-like protein [Georgenia sp. TF02-10]
MKLLVDAQLPPRLATYLRLKGHDAVHTVSLPGGVLVPDAEIAAIADREGEWW